MPILFYVQIQIHIYIYLYAYLINIHVYMAYVYAHIRMPLSRRSCVTMDVNPNIIGMNVILPHMDAQNAILMTAWSLTDSLSDWMSHLTAYLKLDLRSGSDYSDFLYENPSLESILASSGSPNYPTTSPLNPENGCPVFPPLKRHHFSDPENPGVRKCGIFPTPLQE